MITKTVSCTTTAAFVASALAGTWSAVGDSTGTPVYEEYTIGESWESAEELVFSSLQSFIGSATDVIVGGWNMAEQTVYESIANYIGNTTDVDCFRGYLPVNEDGELRQANVWMLTTGGTAGDFDIERTYGAAGNWCSVLTNGELSGVFENRTTAMNFCGAVMAWLKETNNLNKTGNVNWCHLRNLPEAPKERIIKNHRYWEVTIPLEVLYLTESEYGD